MVNTSQANIEDACMFAWVQLLRHEIDEIDAAYSWLTTVAIREAVKLDRADRRTRSLSVDATARSSSRSTLAMSWPRETCSTTRPQ